MTSINLYVIHLKGLISGAEAERWITLAVPTLLEKAVSLDEVVMCAKEAATDTYEGSNNWELIGFRIETGNIVSLLRYVRPEVFGIKMED